jgi:hypothetical protein
MWQLEALSSSTFLTASLKLSGRGLRELKYHQPLCEEVAITIQSKFSYFTTVFRAQYALMGLRNMGLRGRFPILFRV